KTSYHLPTNKESSIKRFLILCSGQRVFIDERSTSLMRIKLKEGKQKELISLAKNNLTWKELGKKTGLSPLYLANELFNEKRLLDEKVYEILCTLAKKDYTSEI